MSMTAKRLGISFTLTLVVIGVVLLMTALTLTVLGGGQLGAWFGQLGETDLQTSVRGECLTKGDQIQRQYCNGYVPSEGECSEYQARASTGHDVPISQADCDWTEDPADRLSDVLQESPADGGGESAVVTVEGNEYDCVAEGHLSSICPAR